MKAEVAILEMFQWGKHLLWFGCVEMEGLMDIMLEISNTFFGDGHHVYLLRHQYKYIAVRSLTFMKHFLLVSFLSDNKLYEADISQRHDWLNSDFGD